MRLLPKLASAATLLSLAALAGCHSAYIDATLRNDTDHPLSLVELDYPTASFGTQTLAPHQTFNYRFKVLGSGPLKLIYTDTQRTEQNAAGPTLEEGDEGKLTVTVLPAGTTWKTTFKNRKTP
jgi:hypothetical protein